MASSRVAFRNGRSRRRRRRDGARRHLSSPDARKADAGRDTRGQGGNLVERKGRFSRRVPLGHKDDSWSLPHVDEVTVSVTDAFAGVSATDSRQPQAEVYRFQNSCDGMRKG